MTQSGKASARLQAGTSLIEALVALLVMAFGMMAVVGLQATLRLNSDVAKQRSEAVRIAQQAMEDWRGFSVLDTTAGRVAYADLASAGAANVTGYTTNTSYSLTRSVVEDAALGLKTLVIRVDWKDRADTTQSISLSSVVAGADPALSGTLMLEPNGAPVKRPLGRHAAIPLQARDLGDGTSAYRPPDGGSTRWVFNNRTGIVTKICTTNVDLVSSADQLSGCTLLAGHLLSGYVAFSTGGTPDAENPRSPALNMGVSLSLTSTGHPGWYCFTDAPTTAAQAATTTRVTYACLIVANAENRWSGRSLLSPAGQDGGEAWRIGNTDASHYKVCRYTTLASDTGPNVQHPLNYLNVKLEEPLVQQNFLVISAIHTCPTDTAAVPANGDFVNSNTRQHQPAPG